MSMGYYFFSGFFNFLNIISWNAYAGRDDAFYIIITLSSLAIGIVGILWHQTP
jgi:hypothetical protein